jgi:hypothetical protein
MKLTRIGFAFTEADMSVMRQIKKLLVAAQGPPVTWVSVIRYALRKAIQ